MVLSEDSSSEPHSSDPELPGASEISLNPTSPSQLSQSAANLSESAAFMPTEETDGSNDGYEPNSISVTNMAPISSTLESINEVETSRIAIESLTIAVGSPTVEAEMSNMDNVRGAGLRRAYENTRPYEDGSRPSTSFAADNTRDLIRSNVDDGSPSVEGCDLDEPPPKKIKTCSCQPSECSICKEPCESSGDHRLVSTKCGHIFGSQCIKRWLQEQPAETQMCPVCKVRADVTGLIKIYGPSVTAVDTSEMKKLQSAIEIIRDEKQRYELQLNKSLINQREWLTQAEALYSSIKTAEDNKVRMLENSWRFNMEKNIEIGLERGCRVLTYNTTTNEIYVSVKSGSSFFPSYGIRKVSCSDLELGPYNPLHSKAIRDIAYSHQRNELLSVSWDRSAKISVRDIPWITVKTSAPLYSCSWDHSRNHEFYVGGGSGAIYHYDIRMPSHYIQELMGPSLFRDISPVVTLCSTEFGLLSCQLKSCWLWKPSNGQEEPCQLPITGSFNALRYDSATQQVLVARRPNGNSGAKLVILKLGVLSNEVSFEVKTTINGSAWSSVMSRPSWVKVPGASWVAASSESDSALHLHGVDGSSTISLPAGKPALDVNCITYNGDTMLAALSESNLQIFKAVPSNLLSLN